MAAQSIMDQAANNINMHLPENATIGRMEKTLFWIMNGIIGPVVCVRAVLALYDA
jgi:hypothetical protein